MTVDELDADRFARLEPVGWVVIADGPVVLVIWLTWSLGLLVALFFGLAFLFVRANVMVSMAVLALLVELLDIGPEE